MKKITENIRQITLSQEDAESPDVNIYLLLNERVLIDIGPGSKQAYNTLIAELSKVNLTIEDINFAVLTHHHSDHVGLIKYLPNDLLLIVPDNLEFYGLIPYKKYITNFNNEKTLTATFKHDIVSKLVQEVIPSISSHNYIMISHAKRILNDFHLNAIQMLGHSSEDIIVSTSNGEIFSGDILIPKIFFNCIYDPYVKEDDDQRLSYYEELSFIEKEAIKVLPGHGRVLDKKDIEKTILVNRKRMKRTEKKVLRAQKAMNTNNVEALCNSVFKSFLPYSKFLPFSEVTSIIQDNGKNES